VANVEKLTFGLRRDIPEAPAFWGARAILNRGRLEFLHDRVDLVYDSPEAKEALVAKLKGGATNKFCKWVEKKAFFPQDREIQQAEFDGVTFYATTNASAGYLYVSACLSGAK
jgi:hypothetical protein